MTNKKRILACSMLAALMLSSTISYAAEARNGVADCTASLNISKYSVEGKIYEGGHPLNPITPKSIIGGTYVSIDINRNTITQSLDKSIQTGQLTVTKNAPASYNSKSATMPCFLNGTYWKTLSKNYN